MPRAIADVIDDVFAAATGTVKVASDAMGADFEAVSPDDGMLRRVAVAEIRPSIYQPRTTFDEVALGELADSMRETGLLQPVSVRPVTPTTEHPEPYELIAGERRWRAAQRLGWTDIPAVVQLLSDEQAAAAAMIENLQRRDLSPLEEARGFALLLLVHRWSQAELARRLGVPRSTVGDRLRLLEIPAPWLELLEAGVLSSSHAAPLHLYREVPERYHAEARANAEKTWMWKRAHDEGRAIAVDEFTRVVHDVYSRYLHPLDDHGWPRCAIDPAAYDGPVVAFKPLGAPQPRRWAADPAVWEPLVRAAEQARPASQATAGAGEAKPVARKGDLKLTLPKKTEIVKQSYHSGAVRGATVLTTTEGRWDIHAALRDLDVAVLAAELTPADVLRVAVPHNSGIDRTATRRAEVVERAAAAWAARWTARAAELTASYRDALATHGGDFAVQGPGVRGLLVALLGVEFDAVATLVECARALGIPVPELSEQTWDWDDQVLREWLTGLAPAEAEQLALAFLAAEGGVVLPPAQQLDREQADARVAHGAVPVPWIEGSGAVLVPCAGCKRAFEGEDLLDGLCTECEDARAPGEENRCVVCGCTDSHACADGCSWLDLAPAQRLGVCSSCAATIAEAQDTLAQHLEQLDTAAAPPAAA